LATVMPAIVEPRTSGYWPELDMLVH
jgi:hypothetical protein